MVTMLCRNVIFASLLALVSAPMALGCSSSEEETDSEDALVDEPRSFNFNAKSTKERRGEVDEGNAYWAARLAALSYEHDQDNTLQEGLRKLGVPFKEAFTFHSSTDAQTKSGAVMGTDGIYVRTQDAGFLVFRGSEDGKYNDMIVDLNVVQIESRFSLNRASAGKVHAGFHLALKSVWEGLREKMVRRHGDGRLPLYLMGHSMGGALATLAMHQLMFDECLNSTLARVDVVGACEEKYVPVAALYTLGSPRVGSEEFSEMLAGRAKELKTPIFRFVNEGDQISMLPRYAPIGVVQSFRHLGAKGDEKPLAILLRKDGSIVPKPTSGCADNPNLVQCDLSLWDGLNGVTGGTPPWKVQHSRTIYLEKLRSIVTRTPVRPDKVRDQ